MDNYSENQNESKIENMSVMTDDGDRNRKIFDYMSKNNPISKIYEYYQTSNLNKGNSNVLQLNKDDYKLLSNYEKKTLKLIGTLLNLIDKHQVITYETLTNMIDQLTNTNSTIEKDYLLSLLFPEKIKNTNVLKPFPIPTYTYIQKFQLYITPNDKGCFLIQAICPLLLDTSSNYSNIYVNNDSRLDGTSYFTNGFTPIQNTKTIQNAFNAYTLHACKLSAKYIGRGDIMSGYFGASYHLSGKNQFEPDNDTTMFAFVDDSINSTISNLTEGINVVYYPPDYSYLTFMKPNIDNVERGSMATSLRLNIYGASLVYNFLIYSHQDH